MPTPAEIRARLSRNRDGKWMTAEFLSHADEDMRFLLAEHDRLSAEAQALQQRLDDVQAHFEEASERDV